MYRTIPSAIAICLIAFFGTCPTSVAQGTIYTIFGQVQRPDGTAASRVSVQIAASFGYAAETTSNDQGQYDFPGLPAGRYRLTAYDPTNPEIRAEAAETDVTRAPGQRVMVHLFLRETASAPGKSPERPVVSVPEMTMQVPKNAQKAYEKALEQKGKGEVDRAAENLEKALAIYPTYFQALTLRGELAVRQGQTAEALQNFSTALGINPDFAPALRGSGFCKLQQRKVTEAALDLERAVQLNPLDSDAHLYLGIATLAMDKRIEARQSLEQALQLAPTGAVTAHVYLANLEAAEGHFRAAADQLASYLAAQPNAPNAEKLRLQEAQWRQRAGQ